jgi:RNA polymerase sigma factor (sigma-70 family)
MESLTKKVLDFQASGKGLHDLVRDLAPTVYQFPRRRMGLDEDACGDFYLYFQPRLVRMLGRYRDTGRSFDAYLKTCLGWQLRNFARGRRSGDRAWETTLRLTAEGDARAGFDQPDGDQGSRSAAGVAGVVAFGPAAGGIASVVRTDADRRSFLFLVLKCQVLVEDRKAEALAAVAGVTVDRLRSLAAVLAERRAPREARLQDFAARRNRAFCRARLLEADLRCETDPERRAALEERLARANRRMRTAMERMAKVGVAPTNREIAEALGIPKGTVDSGLFFLKRKLGAVLGPDTQRSA